MNTPVMSHELSSNHTISIEPSGERLSFRRSDPTGKWRHSITSSSFLSMETIGSFQYANCSNEGMDS